MGESFGNEFTIVEVSPDTGSTTEVWVALAKPNQAVTLVLASVPEGWMARVVPTVLTDRQQSTFEEIKLKPGDVYRLGGD